MFGKSSWKSISLFERLDRRIKIRQGDQSINFSWDRGFRSLQQLLNLFPFLSLYNLQRDGVRLIAMIICLSDCLYSRAVVACQFVCPWPDINKQLPPSILYVDYTLNSSIHLRNSSSHNSSSLKSTDSLSDCELFSSTRTELFRRLKWMSLIAQSVSETLYELTSFGQSQT